jgi:hypothetical protein
VPNGWRTDVGVAIGAPASPCAHAPMLVSDVKGTRRAADGRTANHPAGEERQPPTAQEEGMENVETEQTGEKGSRTRTTMEADAPSPRTMPLASKRGGKTQKGGAQASELQSYFGGGAVRDPRAERAARWTLGLDRAGSEFSYSTAGAGAGEVASCFFFFFLKA